MDALQCCECKKDFGALYNLRKHAKKFHPDKVDVIAPRKTYRYQCEQCIKNFNHLRDFNCHNKKKHPISPSSTSQKTTSKRQCPLCKFIANKLDLLAHFKADHEIQIETSISDFNSFEEFISWKNQIEISTKSQFVKQRGISSTKNQNVVEYFCHRSGNYISKSKGLRHLKLKGTKKINSFCPASIKVIIERNNKCKVFFMDKHVGHENDVGHLSLTYKEREALANKIALKIPFTEILDQVQDSIEGSHLERIHLLNRRDLHNIEQSFNLKSTNAHRQNDVITVDAWVKVMEKSGCILFYKARDMESAEHMGLKKEDFVLIIMYPDQEEMFKKYCSNCVCVDRTYVLNQYDFELHTLFVLDDVGEGFPCAFLISNKSDELIMEIFFQYVKDRIGFQVNCKVFMSDMAESFYNAWKVLMGPSQFRLFCMWHVDRAWRENLSKISSKEKQVMVYKYLRSMLQERDKNAFASMIDFFVSSILNDSSTKEFAEYFRNNFINNIHSWAHCYRLDSGLNNMHIERMHRTIKYIYLNGRSVKRPDKAINEIQKFFRDRLQRSVLNKIELAYKLKQIRAGHKSSEKLAIDLIIKNGLCWEVLSASSDCSEVYSIEEIQNNCSGDCKLMCTDCDACIHTYSCTCMDSCIKWNMCKHVHLLCRYLKQTPILPQMPSSNTDVPVIIDQNPALEEVESSSIKKINDEAKLTKEKENIMESLIPDIMKIAKNITCMEQVDAFKNLCAPIGPTLKSIGNMPTTEMGQLVPSHISQSLPNKIT